MSISRSSAELGVELPPYGKSVALLVVTFIGILESLSALADLKENLERSTRNIMNRGTILNVMYPSYAPLSG